MDPGPSSLSILVLTILISFYLFILLLIYSWSWDGCHNSREYTTCSKQEARGWDRTLVASLLFWERKLPSYFASQLFGSYWAICPSLEQSSTKRNGLFRPIMIHLQGLGWGLPFPVIKGSLPDVHNVNWVLLTKNIFWTVVTGFCHNSADFL